METLTEKARAEGHLRFDTSGKTEKVVYVAVNRVERWSDPEEKVRAEFYAEMIYKYGYAPQRIGVEVTVPDRSPNDFADLVVFHDDERKKPYAVIECKKDGISDAEFHQAVEQAAGNGSAYKFRAAYVGVVAGGTRKFLDTSEKYGSLERDKNVVADLPMGYGKPPEYKYRKGVSKDWQDIRPVNKGELIAAIKKCHQSLWGGGRLSPPAAFGEFCKIIFVKVRDEKASRQKGDPYEFQIKTDEAAPALAKRIKAMYTEAQDIDPEIFKEPIKIDDGTLKMCVSHLEGINFNETDLDTKGVAFEQFLDGFFKGDFGQYFTPREIIQFCVEMLAPDNEDYVLDPACGSSSHSTCQSPKLILFFMALRLWHGKRRLDLPAQFVQARLAELGDVHVVSGADPEVPEHRGLRPGNALRAGLRIVELVALHPAGVAGSNRLRVPDDF